MLKLFVIMLVDMPLKYDKMVGCIHYLLFKWQPLLLDMFLRGRLFLFVKKVDQQICIKLYVKNEIKCTKVCEILTKAYVTLL